MSVGIFQNGKYNKVAGNAKDSTAANTTYNNGTSGLQANNVQSAIDEVSAKIGQENISQVGNSVTGAINNLNSNFENKLECYNMKSIDDIRENHSIGFNIISNRGYFIVNIRWTHFEIMIAENDTVYKRIKYGNHNWTEWTLF